MEKNIHIHFVCRGNIYRSRLAEAYLKSFQHKGWHITSSGIEAHKWGDRKISLQATLTARTQNIASELSADWTQTSNDLLNKADLIVFMADDVYQDAQKAYDFNDMKALVWHVKDDIDWPRTMHEVDKRRGTFRQIKHRVDQFEKDIQAGGWVDIYDEHNRKLDVMLPITITNQKGLWHRGCHVIITTPNNKTLIEQRSKNIFFSPGLIDVTLGGGVDVGEQPEVAALREIKEEVGLDVDPADLRFLHISKWNRYHSKRRVYQRTFLYSYHVALKENNPTTTIQSEELAGVKFLSMRQTKRLVRLHRLVGLGRLTYSYAYFARLVKDVEQALISKI